MLKNTYKCPINPLLQQHLDFKQHNNIFQNILKENIIFRIKYFPSTLQTISSESFK